MKPIALLALALIGASPVAAANTGSVLRIPRTAGAPQLANFLGMSPAGENAMAKIRGFRDIVMWCSGWSNGAVSY